ncbi:MAG: thioesterase family protein [Myxococcota bacterium]
MSDLQPIDKINAFYEIDGARFVPTPFTRGPWSPVHQHAGPPAALLARAAAALEADPAVRVARLTFDILRPVPVRPLTLRCDMLTRGRIAERVAASLWDGDKEVMRALVLRLRTEAVELEPRPNGLDAPRPPEEAAEMDLPIMSGDVGYHKAVAIRLEHGAIGSGRARAWLRPSIDLVAGEPMTPLEGALVCADAGSGVSQALDVRRWSFVNADLTVHLQRPPEGGWVCLDARTVLGRDGTAMAETRLWDTAGAFGLAEQMLVVRPVDARGRP